MKHLILIGFKNVGKSTIGQKLATKLKLPFIDLDDEMVKEHQKIIGEKCRSCRDIMKQHGDDFFRDLEHQVLKKILQMEETAIIAVGGGTPMLETNRQLMKNHLVIWIEVPKSIVFERIMMNGKPAFFPKDQEAMTSFQNLWQERTPIFQSLATLSVENNGSIENTVEKLCLKLQKPVTS